MATSKETNKETAKDTAKDTGKTAMREENREAGQSKASTAERGTSQARGGAEEVLRDGEKISREAARQSEEMVYETTERAGNMAEQALSTMDRSATLGVQAMQGMMNGNAAETWMRYLQVSSQGMTQFGEEISRFTTTRLNRDGETLREAGQCRGVDELMQVQQKWLRQAGEDYMEEINRLLCLSLRFSDTLMQPAGKAGRQEGNASSSRSAR